MTSSEGRESPPQLSAPDEPALRRLLYGWAAVVTEPRSSLERHGENCRCEQERLAPLVEPIVSQWAAEPDAVHVGLTAVLAAGLNARLGLFLSERELDLMASLLSHGADRHSGARRSVCASCALVFAPRRQDVASKCPHCHKRSNTRPQGWRQICTDLVFQTPAGPRKVARCCACRGSFFATKTNQMYCTPSCRKGRSPRRPELVVSPEVAPVFAETFTEPLSATFQQFLAGRAAPLGVAVRTAACDRCHDYYATTDPAHGRCPDCE